MLEEKKFRSEQSAVAVHDGPVNTDFRSVQPFGTSERYKLTIGKYLNDLSATRARVKSWDTNDTQKLPNVRRIQRMEITSKYILKSKAVQIAFENPSSSVWQHC